MKNEDEPTLGDLIKNCNDAMYKKFLCADCGRPLIEGSCGGKDCPLLGVPRSEKTDMVNHPKHYTKHKSGVECIEVTRHMGFNLGNCVKYIWRADLKGNAIEDLEKAAWYLADEIEKRKKGRVI